jgi:hypothetical protein
MKHSLTSIQQQQQQKKRHLLGEERFKGPVLSLSLRLFFFSVVVRQRQ